jgi:hypothetical protein
MQENIAAHGCAKHCSAPRWQAGAASCFPRSTCRSAELQPRLAARFKKNETLQVTRSRETGFPTFRDKNKYYLKLTVNSERKHRVGTRTNGYDGTSRACTINCCQGGIKNTKAVKKLPPYCSILSCRSDIYSDTSPSLTIICLHPSS